MAPDVARGDPARLELIPRLGDQDPTIERLALGIADALTDPDPSASVYADYLARAFAIRLLRTHSTRAGPAGGASPGGGGLTRAQLARAVECMEAGLAGPLSLDSIAATAGLSPAHFARRFKASTGEAPHQHLLRLRLARAKRLLRESDRSIAQIAYECGFSHQEHMTRFFGRLTGTTPAAYRRAARS